MFEDDGLLCEVGLPLTTNGSKKGTCVINKCQEQSSDG